MKIKKVIKRWSDCERCALHRSREHIVFYRGNVKARIALVGEAPGATEDREGQPFVGDAGDVLDECLEAVGLEPWDVFICNTVGCRPPLNRKPTEQEFERCSGRLYAMLMTVKPEAILLLGGTALELLTGEKGIMKVRGTLMNVSIPWKNKQKVFKAVPTLHPAYLLRNRREEVRNLVVADIRKVIELSQDGSFLER